MAERHPKKRDVRTLLEKVTIIKEVDANKKSKADIAEKYGIPRSTLSTILKMREHLLKAYNSSDVAAGRKRLRTAAHSDVGEALLNWFRETRDKNIAISSEMLKKKAQQFALDLGIKDFEASNPWVWRFKLRHGIPRRVACRDFASVRQGDGVLKETTATSLIPEPPPCAEPPLSSVKTEWYTATVDLPGMSGNHPRKRSQLSLQEKVTIIKEVDAKKKKKSDIAKEYGIPHSTLSTILKMKEALLKAYSRSDVATSRKRLRTAFYGAVEEALLKWLKESRDENMPVSIEMLKTKAQQFAFGLGIEKFEASNSWVSRFKARHKILRNAGCKWYTASGDLVGIVGKSPSTRLQLSLQEKVTILKEINAKKKKKVEIAKEYGIPHSTLSTIWKMREELLKAYSRSDVASGRKRLRTAVHGEVEAAVFKWFTERRVKNMPISIKMLKKKAQQFAFGLGMETFEASNGWVSRFKKRHGIPCRPGCRDSASVRQADYAVQETTATLLNSEPLMYTELTLDTVKAKDAVKETTVTLLTSEPLMSTELTLDTVKTEDAVKETTATLLTSEPLMSTELPLDTVKTEESCVVPVSENIPDELGITQLHKVAPLLLKSKFYVKCTEVGLSLVLHQHDYVVVSVEISTEERKCQTVLKVLGKQIPEFHPISELIGLPTNTNEIVGFVEKLDVWNLCAGNPHARSSLPANMWRCSRTGAVYSDNCFGLVILGTCYNCQQSSLSLMES